MQTRRRIVQLAFLALTVVGVFVVRGNAEQWCPFGGVEAIYLYLHKGQMLCSLGVSNFYILAAVLVLTLLLRRVFCSYMCPIGTISEWIGSMAKRLGFKPRRVSPAADRVLSLLKYLVLAIILWFTWNAGELMFRTADPCYALISRHGEDITYWAYIVSGAILIGSALVLIPFCRWLCPLAVVFNPFSRFGFFRIWRNEETCTSCGKCYRVCPMAIPVDSVKVVHAARCTACLNCVSSCPVIEDGAIGWGPPAHKGRSWPQATIFVIMLALVSSAVAAVYWFPMPSYVYERGSRPAQVASVDLKVEGLTCRGKATLLSQMFLDRDDELALPGYLKVEAWPGPGFVPVRVFYNAAQADAEAVRKAVTEAYYNAGTDAWTVSPFVLGPTGTAPAP